MLMCAEGPGSISGEGNLDSGFHPAVVGERAAACMWMTATEDYEIKACGLNHAANGAHYNTTYG